MKYKFEIWDSASMLTSSHEEVFDTEGEAREEAEEAIESILDDWEIDEAITEDEREDSKQSLGIEIIEVENEDEKFYLYGR